MSMKDAINEIVGKTISGIVSVENEHHAPRHQLILLFSDGTSFEFYGDSFTCAAGIDAYRDLDLVERALREDSRVVAFTAINLSTKQLH